MATIAQLEVELQKINNERSVLSAEAKAVQKEIDELVAQEAIDNMPEGMAERVTRQYLKAQGISSGEVFGNLGG